MKELKCQQPQLAMWVYGILPSNIRPYVSLCHKYFQLYLLNPVKKDKRDKKDSDA